MSEPEKKTGVIVVVHGGYGKVMVSAAESIVGELDVLIHDVTPNESISTLNEKIQAVIQGKNRGRGVLVLTDLFGSTPSNICFASLERSPECEVVTGINLPMLLKLSTCDRSKSPKEIAQALLETGRRSIVIGSNLLFSKGGRSDD